MNDFFRPKKMYTFAMSRKQMNEVTHTLVREATCLISPQNFNVVLPCIWSLISWKAIRCFLP